MMTRLVIAVLRLYQLTISPDHSVIGRALFPLGCCRFYPSCSAYAVAVLERRGFSGLGLVVWRLLRCHPWSAGGFDNVRDKTTYDPIRTLSPQRGTGFRRPLREGVANGGGRFS